LPDERVPIAHALHAYTAGSAYQAFDDAAGRIAVGAPADLCLVGADLTAIGGLEVADVPVLGTWVGGRRVYGA
jgi:predicted amidohydrolase YtcJ